MCNIKLLKIKSQFKWTVGAGYLEEPAGELSCKVNNHPRFIYFMTLYFVYRVPVEQGTHPYIEFPHSTVFVLGQRLERFCYDRPLSLEGSWSAQVVGSDQSPPTGARACLLWMGQMETAFSFVSFTSG